MKPVLNKVPKRPMFICNRMVHPECQTNCRIDACTPHTHENDFEYMFFCDQMQRHVKCMQIK